jgi:DNA-directed RNA polymerase specialized sigma24 family protein
MGSEAEPDDVRKRFQQLYDRLCSVAEGVLRRRPQSITPTDLVHEAFVALQQEEQKRQAAARSQLGQKPDSVFKACFGAACRDVLADRRRRQHAKRRGGGVAHEEARSTIAVAGNGPNDEASVNDAIDALRQHDLLMAAIVEARIYGGLSVAECAGLFDVSPSTVDRHWRFGKAWLRERLL